MILLVGASASGKSEIAKYLQEAHSMKKAITHTSRKPRVGEKDGVDYHFVSKEEFERLFAQGELLEKTNYSGNYYGCSRKELADDKCVILDPNGIKTFQKVGDPRLITFYLQTEKKIREERMILRGDAPEAIKERLRLDDETFALENIGKVDFIITTSDRPIKEIGEEIYRKYQDALSKI